MSDELRADGRFTVKAWSESAFIDIDGTGVTAGDNYYPNRGLTRAEVTNHYTGDIDGTGTLTYLISYTGDSAPVIGFERFVGTIGGQDGSCVFRHIGRHDAETVDCEIDVVAGLGTGGLADLRGTATLAIAGHSDDGYPITLGYAIE